MLIKAHTKLTSLPNTQALTMNNTCIDTKFYWYLFLEIWVAAAVFWDHGLKIKGTWSCPFGCEHGYSKDSGVCFHDPLAHTCIYCNIFYSSSCTDALVSLSSTSSCTVLCICLPRTRTRTHFTYHHHHTSQFYFCNSTLVYVID